MTSLTREGALYELVARGNKDAYFFNNEFSSVNPFDLRYNYTPAQVHERRRIPPLNSSEFGRTSEFEFEVAGEIFTDPTILIDLPSWLPPTQAARNTKSQTTDLSGVSYGYTNGIAYFLFSKIQVYVDQILLQEFSGDALFATTRSRGSLNQAFLDNQITGTHNATAKSIARAATPQQLRLRIPLIGCQHHDDGGFPSIGTRQQTYKLRVTLRKLEDLIEASDGQAKPAPWDKPFLQDGQPFQTLVRTQIGAPTLQLETRHTYVDGETRKKLQETTLEIPFSRIYENSLTFGAVDYAPLKRAAVATGTRRIDATHPASRIVFWSHSTQDLRANKYAKVTADISGSEYYNNIALYIAGRDREINFPPLVWNRLQVLAKEDRDPGQGLGFMSWDLGDLRGRRAPFARQPEGSVNFTSADRPTFLIDLAGIPVDPVTGQQGTEFRAVIDTWAVFQTENGRGGLKYGN
jgi:hypothetical protein